MTIKFEPGFITVDYPNPFSGSFEGRLSSQRLSIGSGGTSLKLLQASWLRSLGLSCDPEEPEQFPSKHHSPASCTE